MSEWESEPNRISQVFGERDRARREDRAAGRTDHVGMGIHAGGFGALERQAAEDRDPPTVNA